MKNKTISRKIGNQLTPMMFLSHIIQIIYIGKHLIIVLQSDKKFSFYALQIIRVSGGPLASLKICWQKGRRRSSDWQKGLALEGVFCSFEIQGWFWC